jgi:predicted TIM-barrel fold metal-dependent hydrolase
MRSRREFLTAAGGLAAGIVCVSCGMPHAARAQTRRREISIGGRRVTTIDVHAHCVVTEVLDVVKGTEMERRVRELVAPGGLQNQPVGEARLADMGRDGVDRQVLSINPFWYGADVAHAAEICAVQNEGLAKMCAAYPGRFAAFAAVALQHPELAAEQLETAVKSHGLKGAMIGGSINGDELSHRKFDPFWAKAVALGATIFMHPQSQPEPTGMGKRLAGPGVLGNVIGHPIETTLAISHLIFDGTLDRFPKLTLLFAHAGGYLPSYAARMDQGCAVFPKQCEGPQLARRPSDYLRQLYFDSLIFTGEGLRHLVAQCGASQIMLGSDSPIPWVEDPVGHVLATPELGDADRIAILSGNAERVLKM